MKVDSLARAVSAGSAALVAAALLIGGAGPAPAANRGYGILVGKVTNTSSRMSKRRIFVEVGGKKWALHLNNTARIVHAGRVVSVHDIDTDVYVKASGWRIGKLRLDVDRLDVIGDRAAYRKSRAHRADAPDGYYRGR